MADSSKANGSQLFEKYEIAEPSAYPVFSTPGLPHALSFQPIAEVKPGPYHEDWDDVGKTAPYNATVRNLVSPSTTDTKKELGEKPPRETRAIWIVHGMGQQIPFETVDSLAQGLLSVARPKKVTPRLRTVKIGDETLQRVELDIAGVARDENGQPKKYYELHLYESYWAPKTEGVAKLADVVSFLWDGGLRGLLNSRKCFQRAMFGEMEKFLISIRTPIWICLTLLILLALTVINGVILAAAAGRTKMSAFASLPGAHWNQLTAFASCMTAVALTFGTILFLAHLSQPHKLREALKLMLATVSWLALSVTVLAILTTALLMVAITHLDWVGHAVGEVKNTDLHRSAALITQLLDGVQHPELQGFATAVILSCAALVALSMTRRAILRSSDGQLQGDWLLLVFLLLALILNMASVVVPILCIWDSRVPTALKYIWTPLQSSVWVWPFLIALSAKIRTLMIQFVGDVAIYVRPNKLDRFENVRSKIKEAGRSVASAVYTVCRPGTNHFLYDEIAVVGHSLGSVIAYDTMNRLMLDDWLSGNHLGIANRTNSMVTFGSPLNKTAFFFTIQGKDNMHIRERLAATVQPLIQSYPKFRKFMWINVHSKNDIISGPLEFYDLPGMQGMVPLPNEAVHNVVDKDAAVPLVAHVDYWKNETVWIQLLSQIAP